MALERRWVDPAKRHTMEKIDAYFKPFREKRKDLANHLEYVEESLCKGARKARVEAQATMKLVREAVGMKGARVE